MSREPLSCADEAEAFGDHAHSHSHSHGHSHGHGHGHDHEDPDGFSLLQFIDVHRAWCLNALDTRPLPGLFRPYAQRLEHVPELRSEEDDPELIVHVPFTNTVKIKSICVIGGDRGMSPKEMRVFVNREDVDFDAAQDMPATQKWELVENLEGEVEYPTRLSKFQTVNTITLYFPESFGGDQTRLSFLGFKGEWTPATRQVVECEYEVRGMPDPTVMKQEEKQREVL